MSIEAPFSQDAAEASDPAPRFVDLVVVDLVVVSESLPSSGTTTRSTTTTIPMTIGC
jgi:hypothetical protein